MVVIIIIIIPFIMAQNKGEKSRVDPALTCRERSKTNNRFVFMEVSLPPPLYCVIWIRDKEL